MKRMLETLAVLLWILSSRGVLGLFGLIGFFYILLYTHGYVFPVAYLLWTVARRLGFLQVALALDGQNWCRNWKLWKDYCDYFPIRLVKTVDLELNKNYILACHPHGVFAFGTFGNFATEGSNIRKLFPKLKMHFLMHGLPLKLPFSELLTSLGIMSVDKSSFDDIFSKNEDRQGQVAVLIPGGVQEIPYAEHGGKIVRLHLKSRKGFVKMALKHGASLVPVFNFGENKSFNQVSTKPESLLYGVGEKLGLHLLLPNGNGLLGYKLPNRVPITSVVGAPIHVEKTVEPSLEEVNRLHQTYIAALLRLFEENKVKFGASDQRVQIL